MTRPAVHASCRILPTYKDLLPRLISELFSSPLTLSGQSRLGRPAPVFNHDITAPGFDATHVPRPRRSLSNGQRELFSLTSMVQGFRIPDERVRGRRANRSGAQPRRSDRKGRQRLDGGWSRHGTSGRGDPPHPLQPGRRRRPGEPYRSALRRILQNPEAQAHDDRAGKRRASEVERKGRPRACGEQVSELIRFGGLLQLQGAAWAQSLAALLCACSPSCSFDQAAAHHRCCKFASETVVKTSKLLDGYKFEADELEGAAGYQLLELRYSRRSTSIWSQMHVARPRWRAGHRESCRRDR